MAKKETAEQKLLKIIEATKKAQASASGAEAVPVSKKSSVRIPVTLRHVNMALAVAVVAGAVYFIYELGRGFSLLGQEADISVESVVPKESLNLFLPQMKSISFYLDKMSARDLFKPYEKKDGAAGTPSGKAALEKKMSKYKLVGVAWLDVPESATVMIEDKSNGSTRFLKEGEKIDDVTIKTIYVDRVVVGYENEEIVIKL